MLDRKVPLRFSQPTEIINFAKAYFTERNWIGGPESTCFPKLCLRWRNTNPTLFLSSFPEDADLEVKILGSDKSIPTEQVMTALHSSTSFGALPTALLIHQMPPLGGTGNRSGKNSFTKLMCPGCCFPLLLVQRGRNTTSPGCRLGHWQPPTVSLLLTPWCLCYTGHLLTFQCGLHLYFPKNHHDQNYHLSDLNYF